MWLFMWILFYNGFINWILFGNIGKSRFYDMMNLDFESIVLEQKRMFFSPISVLE